MPSYAVQAQLVFSSAATRDAVHAEVDARRAGGTRVPEDLLLSSELPERPNALLVGIRFAARADQDALRAYLDALTPLPGSWLTVHDCTHVDGSNGCGVTVAERWW